MASDEWPTRWSPPSASVSSPQTDEAARGRVRQVPMQASIRTPVLASITTTTDIPRTKAWPVTTRRPPWNHPQRHSCIWPEGAASRQQRGPLPVRTAARSAQRGQSWASPMAFRPSGRGRRFERTHQTQTEPGRFLADHGEAERRLPARRTSGQRQRRRRAGHHLVIDPGRGDSALKLWVCPLPRQSWTARRTDGRAVQRQSSQMLSRRTSSEPGRARGHIRAVPPGTAWPVLAADSCGCGSAGEGAPHGVPHRVAVHEIRQHAAGAVGGTLRGRARGHPAGGPADPHPGIRGDRGPPSLSWAILTGASRWGLTMVRAEPATRPEELRSVGGAAAHRPVGA